MFPGIMLQQFSTYLPTWSGASCLLKSPWSSAETPVSSSLGFLQKPQNLILTSALSTLSLHTQKASIWLRNDKLSVCILFFFPDPSLGLDLGVGYVFPASSYHVKKLESPLLFCSNQLCFSVFQNCLSVKKVYFVWLTQVASL